MHAVKDLKLSRTTLNRYRRENRLIDLSLEPRNYYVDVADEERIEEEREKEERKKREEAERWSPGLGGKRKTKKHKKSKKIKKSRKTRKIRNKYKNKN